MRIGKPTGAAMPLVWAHAEYVRLVRSLADGEIFDRIAPVAERYLAGKGRRGLEVWKPSRQVRTVERGETLRIEAPAPFRLRWTDDDWHTHKDTGATDGGLDIHYVDIPAGNGERGSIKFTFFWLDDVNVRSFQRTRDRWEGRDYAVDVR